MHCNKLSRTCNSNTTNEPSHSRFSAISLYYPNFHNSIHWSLPPAAIKIHQKNYRIASSPSKHQCKHLAHALAPCRVDQGGLHSRVTLHTMSRKPGSVDTTRDVTAIHSPKFKVSGAHAANIRLHLTEHVRLIPRVSMVSGKLTFSFTSLCVCRESGARIMRDHGF